MTSPILADVVASVTKARGAEDSATALINGFATKLQAAVDAALANGASEAELQPVSQLVTDLNTASDALAAAVAANP